MTEGGGSGLVVRPVFKTATEAPRVSPVGSIPTRSRHLALGILSAFVLWASPVAAQDTTRAAPDTMVVVDAEPAAGADTSVFRRAPVSPMGAFFRSLLVPGWGQAALERRVTGGLFLAWEGVTLGMAVKAHREARYLKRTGSPLLGSKRQEREDWITLVVVNHLFAALEAFVASHLWDFPEDLRVRAAPVPGGVGAAVTIPVRLP
jgi:hypothetical protein